MLDWLLQEVVRAQGLEVTPTAMFAALMARCGWWGHASFICMALDLLLAAAASEHPAVCKVQAAACGADRLDPSSVPDRTITLLSHCSLEKPETLASSEVLAAMCHLLSLVRQG